MFANALNFSFIHYNLEVGLIGTPVDLTYDYEHLGTNAKALDDLLAGKGKFAEVSRFSISQRVKRKSQ